MPYITESAREQIALQVGRMPNTAGELNYCFTYLALAYIDHRGLSYEILNDAVGALECAKQELLRRVVAPYEDRKIKENGDIQLYEVD